MKFSLLTKNTGEDSRFLGEGAEGSEIQACYADFNGGSSGDIIYDLSVDRSVCSFFADRRRADFFLSVVRRPCLSREDIIYRQRLLGDFIAHRELFDELKLIFSRYDKIKSDWIELRSAVRPAGSGSNSEALLEYTFSSLKVTAVFPRTIISFFESIYRAIEKYEVKSEALSGMLRFCREMAENNSLGEIADISSLFQYRTPEDFDFEVACRLDRTLRLESCELCGIAEKKKKAGGIWRLLELKKKDDGPPEISAEGEAADNARFILTESLCHIDAVLTSVTNDVYEIFYGLSRELMFYEVALSYAEFATEAGLPLCVPEILEREGDTFEAEGLCDLLLAAQGKKGSEIIPNRADFGPDARGVLIRGMNNTGKTTFLRSIGTAQLFAQAGLPVCAERAKISIRSAVFTHFSAAEEEFTQGDTSGRFEGEVKEIARIMGALRPYSLVLLNETFQTTAYDEGAAGIYNILSAFARINVKYIFVTHLLKLFSLCAGDGVRLMETGFGFAPAGALTGENVIDGAASGKDKYTVKKIAE